jgi:hypothetical protein
MVDRAFDRLGNMGDSAGDKLGNIGDKMGSIGDKTGAKLDSLEAKFDDKVGNMDSLDGNLSSFGDSAGAKFDSLSDTAGAKMNQFGNIGSNRGVKLDASGNQVEWNDSDSWLKFLKALFSYFILALLVGLFGSSFIYLTSRGSDLDIILPTDDLFYSAPSYEVKRNGPYTDVNCNETPSGSFAVFEDNFPYNLIITKGSSKEELDGLSFSSRLSNWFGKTVAGCFKSNRALLKGWLDNFTPNSPLGNHTFQIYVGFPVTICLSLVSLITGFWAAFGAATGADMKITIWGGFLLYSWALLLGLASVIFLRLIGTLCFLPMSQNWKEVANIMACNAKSIVILFGFFACGAAYDNLDPTVSGIMGIIYLILVAYSLWSYFSSKIDK